MEECRQDILIYCFLIYHSYVVFSHDKYDWIFLFFTDQVFLPKFDGLYETVSVVVGQRALLPCYVSLQDAKNNGSGSFKVIIIYIYDL